MKEESLALWQIYKNVGIHSTYFDYVQITNNPILIKNLNSLKPVCQTIIYDQILPQLKRANHINEENLIERIIVSIKIEGNRVHKWKVLKSFKDINLLWDLGNDRYVINIAYFNPLNSEQTNKLLIQSQIQINLK